MSFASLLTFKTCSRYRRTRRLSSGWMSQAISKANERIRARSGGEAGSNGGSGCVSSRYSIIDSDWVRTRSPSISVGTACCGLTRAYSELWCSFLRKLRNTFSYGSSFKFNAMRTRNAAEDGECPYSFIRSTLPPPPDCEGPDSADINLHHIARFHEYRRGPLETHSTRRTGWNDISGDQLGEGAEVLDQHRDRKN